MVLTRYSGEVKEQIYTVPRDWKRYHGRLSEKRVEQCANKLMCILSSPERDSRAKAREFYMHLFEETKNILEHKYSHLVRAMRLSC